MAVQVKRDKMVELCTGDYVDRKEYDRVYGTVQMAGRRQREIAAYVFSLKNPGADGCWPAKTMDALVELDLLGQKNQREIQLILMAIIQLNKQAYAGLRDGLRQQVTILK